MCICLATRIHSRDPLIGAGDSSKLGLVDLVDRCAVHSSPFVFASFSSFSNASMSNAILFFDALRPDPSQGPPHRQAHRRAWRLLSLPLPITDVNCE